ncbi:ABC transporter permease [Spirosoma endophyticum]|uniref:ABC-type antimicrobial peptide transport system, permease component n=1 Tax=Spirosoma endophyticum TaxID=662367 RepID=A0A1I1Z667_9BACT|nr:ABC transporter permease [Spirosoma endophyticum]SFE27231.1 ABC-type antimicrobial peptide transport system, permease component [Spirosoma endophyticum]
MGRLTEGRQGNPYPPHWVNWLLNRFSPVGLEDELQGDLLEMHTYWVKTVGPSRARWRYTLAVLRLIRPFTSSINKQSHNYSEHSTWQPAMIRNYLKIAWRNLLRYKAFSAINIVGLATGMAVAMLIGLWIYDELSFDRQPKESDHIAQVWQIVQFDGQKAAYNVASIPLAQELRSHYPDFDRLALATAEREAVLATGENRFTQTGRFVESDFLPMMSVRMRTGPIKNLTDVNTIVLSQSLSTKLFGSEDPLNHLVRLDNKVSLRVTGVYQDFPINSSFNTIHYLAPWPLFLRIDQGAKSARDNWDENSYQVFAQVKEGASLAQASAKIKDIRMKQENPPPYKPEFFLHPMTQWHLYSNFDNGVNTGGLIQVVWLFSLIGGFVLLLACINFMNLSTARSQQRAKEVGLRKVVGSLRGQLITQFLGETLLLTSLAFVVALGLVQLSLPFFNQLADKQITILWFNPYFWAIGVGFSLITGLIAASYPALYLSSFQPISVLKGSFSAGQQSSLPRKALVVFQFTVSVTLIIGTCIVLRQIDYAKNRPTGYSRQGLLEIPMRTPALMGHFDALRTDLLATGAIQEMAISNMSVTADKTGVTNVSWPGKSPDLHPLFMTNQVSHQFGRTIGWRVSAGRDFSTAFSRDSLAVVVNQSALKLMGLKDPLHSMIHWNGRDLPIVGIINDMIKDSPFGHVQPTLFVLYDASAGVLTLRLTPTMAISDALTKIAGIFQQYDPSTPFAYKFVDEEYRKKFSTEERIGKLATLFASLAIFISCLGMFGLASFMAEQRRKEIGIRKVLGATVLTLWALLAKDFVGLVLLGCVLASPIAWYFLHEWLQSYTYRTQISGWVFVLSGVGALSISMLTVSYQSIKAALMNPVNALKND